MNHLRTTVRIFIAVLGALSLGILITIAQGARTSNFDSSFADLVLFNLVTLVAAGLLFVWLILLDLKKAMVRVDEDARVQETMSEVNKTLMEQQSAQINQLALLNQVMATLSGTLSPDTLIEHIISCASVLTDATGYTIYTNWNNHFELTRSVGLQGMQITAITDPLMIQVAGNDGREQSILVLSDLASDVRASKLRVSGVQHRFASVVELPLTAGGHLLGMMGLYYPQRVPPDDPRLEILKTFSTQAAQALYNAHQYVEANEAFQRNAERLMTLAVLSRSLSSSVDVASMCGQVIDEILLATGASVGLLALLDDFNSSPQIGAIRGISDDNAQYDSLLSTLKRIDPGRGAYIVRRDTHSFGMPQFLTADAQSMLIVPMVQASFLFGAIWLESPSTEIFDSEDIRFVEQISNQAVIALENARLFQRLEGDRERMARLLDTMVEGIMMIDPQGDVVLANPRMNIIGLQPDMLLNANLLSLLESDIPQFAQRVGFATHEDAVDFVMNMQNHLHDADVKTYAVNADSIERSVERKIVPVISGEVVLGHMLVFYDRSGEKELQRSREELTNMIVHDLRSPLSAVTTSLRLLQDMIPRSSPSWPVVESTTDMSRRAVKKILNRVNSLLDIAKLQSGGMTINRETTTFKQLVGSVFDELEPLAREMKIELVIDNGVKQDIPLQVDIDKTERVLLNFVDNALKYSPMNTRITLRQHMTPQNNDGRQFVRIDIIDQGPGVPEEYKKKLFESFVQVQGRRSSRGGVGLGLTFAKLTIEAHGGAVWIEDNPEGGSIFAFTLPTA